MNELEQVKSDQCLVGWRTWHFLEPHYLSDIGHRMLWEPRKASEAKCKQCEVIPGETCTCGLYSFTTKEEMFAQHYAAKDTMVWGTVWLWGRVIEHRRGFKASQSYFKELWVHPSLAHLAEWFGFVYGVPVNVVQPSDIPEEQRQEYMGYRPPAAARPITLTADKMWIFIHHPQVPLPMRRSLRNQLRARWMQSAEKKKERIENLYSTITQVRKDREEQLAKITHMDELLRQWNSGEVK